MRCFLDDFSLSDESDDVDVDPKMAFKSSADLVDRSLDALNLPYLEYKYCYFVFICTRESEREKVKMKPIARYKHAQEDGYIEITVS